MKSNFTSIFMNINLFFISVNNDFQSQIAFSNLPLDILNVELNNAQLPLDSRSALHTLSKNLM